MSFNIAIIGAGPVGCALARLLQHRRTPNPTDDDSTTTDGPVPINVTIFEAEQSLDMRSQGGTLDLHPSTGQAALRAAGLFDAFRAHARYDGEALQITDKNFLRYVRMPGAAAKKEGAEPGAATKKDRSITGRPEIDRPALRRLLYESVRPGTVKWGRKVVGVEAETGTVRFVEAGGPETKAETGFDLIVGADGAWSRVRAAVSEVRPYYSGVGGYSLIISEAETRFPELWARTNRGSVFAFGDGKSIMPQCMGDGSINVGVWARRDEHWRRDLGDAVEDAEAVRKAMRAEHADWDPRLVEFTQRADDRVVARDLYMLPVGHSWEHVSRVTLVSDAAHVMTPFAGEGVNLGLRDAMELAEAILSTTPGDKAQLDSKVAGFEQDMFKRATATQQMTVDMMNAMYFTPGAPRACIERYLIRAAGSELGWVGTTLITPLIYMWFFVFKLIW